ncbi:hypothetical protein PPHE_b0639 [Pseudoalteromonas phenolica O-BC30]|nr:hypothetical protein [Pseudoalteromonas phenolica O-BC30]
MKDLKDAKYQLKAQQIVLQEFIQTTNERITNGSDSTTNCLTIFINGDTIHC